AADISNVPPPIIKDRAFQQLVLLPYIARVNVCLFHGATQRFFVSLELGSIWEICYLNDSFGSRAGGGQSAAADQNDEKDNSHSKSHLLLRFNAAPAVVRWLRSSFTGRPSLFTSSTPKLAQALDIISS